MELLNLRGDNMMNLLNLFYSSTDMTGPISIGKITNLVGNFSTRRDITMNGYA